MIPEWMKSTDEYAPPSGSSNFVLRSIKSIGGAMSRIKIQKGHEKKKALPALLKLFIMFFSVLIISVTHERLVIMAFAAVMLGYLCTWPAKDIPGIIKTSIIGACFSLLILIPAIIINPELIRNEILIVVKVFLSIMIVSIFNHTTQWNHITKALRQLHIPGLFVFIIDITLKYIVLLGNLITDLLTSLQLRSVGKNNQKYQSVGGVMGVTFIRGAEMNRQMYEAMQCRGFTDDYKGL